MLFPRMMCKIPEVLLRRSLANSRDTSCHRSVIAATRHPGILAAWISPDYTLNQCCEENDVLIILVHHTYCEDKNSHFQLLPSFDFRKSQCKTGSSSPFFSIFCLSLTISSMGCSSMVDKNSPFQLLPSSHFRKSQCKISSSLAYFFHFVIFPDYIMNG